MKKIFIVVGTRPNFMKIHLLVDELKKLDVPFKIIHTGQHYDEKLSDVFIEDLNLPKIDYNFSIGSHSHGKQTGLIMSKFEDLCLKEQPDIVLVVGDVNSTLACSLVVSKIKNIKLAHIESGLRRNTIDTPEEVNRRVTDLLSDILFCTNEKSVNNLLKENIDSSKIHLVGDTMIDSIIDISKKIEISEIEDDSILVTIHRPHNTDNIKRLKKILDVLNKISKNNNIVFPVHPRTLKTINDNLNISDYNMLNIVNPMGRVDFIKNMIQSKLVISDSGGVQIETTALGIPCITLSPETVHRDTLTKGTNILSEPEELLDKVNDVLDKNIKKKKTKPLFDGNSYKKIARILQKYEK